MQSLVKGQGHGRSLSVWILTIFISLASVCVLTLQASLSTVYQLLTAVWSRFNAQRSGNHRIAVSF